VIDKLQRLTEEYLRQQNPRTITARIGNGQESTQYPSLTRENDSSSTPLTSRTPQIKKQSNMDTWQSSVNKRQNLKSASTTIKNSQAWIHGSRALINGKA